MENFFERFFNRTDPKHFRSRKDLAVPASTPAVPILEALMSDVPQFAGSRLSNSALKEISDLDIEEAFRTILAWIGEDPQRDGLRETPSRVRRAFLDYFSGYRKDPGRILRDGLTKIVDDREVIVLRDVPFHSHCEHHFAPIIGFAWIAYLPNRHRVGVSKLERVIEAYAKRLQIQERLTAQLANSIDAVLKPKGVAVLLKATHFCMIGRGVRARGTELVTSKMLGCFRSDALMRRQFLALAHRL
jgi:GTP cyclohydrolase IA